MSIHIKQTYIFLFALAFALVISIAASAQSLGTAGTINGKVVDSSGAVIKGANVEIRNAVTGFQRTIATDDDGLFTFRNVPQNSYHMAITAIGFVLVQQDVDVRSSVPIDLITALKVATSNESVEVRADAGDLLENDPSAHTDVDSSVAGKIPMESSSSALSQIITYSSPGVVADSNGFFHPLGDHAQTSFSMDSQPISDQQSRVYSNQIAASAIQSMELITGVPPAEYGDKSSLVAVVTTKSGLGQTEPTGSITYDYGSFGTSNATINMGVGNAKYGNFFSANGLRTGRFLDPPEFDSIHNTGNSENFFDRVDFQPSAADTFHLDLFLARSWFQAPNTFDQAAAGQDQRQQMKTFNFAPGWTHLLSPSTLLTANAYIRQDHVQYLPSADPFADQPETVAQNRRLQNSGFRVDISHVKGKHNIKAGFQFSHAALSESFNFGITDPTNNPVCLDSSGSPVLDPTLTDPAQCAPSGFAQNPDLQIGLVPFDLTRGGNLLHFRDTGSINEEVLYAQDNITLGNLNVNIGLRGEHYKGLTEANSLDPRIGLAYHIVATNTVLRGGYAHTLETPYNENLLLSSATGNGGLAQNIFSASVTAPLRSGRRNQYNVGFQQALGRYLVIDGEYFWKYTHNAYDFNTLEDTPITFPISWRQSKLDGFDIRVNLPEVYGFRAYTIMGHTRARYFNPETGGLFFDNNPPTGVFRIDHDQAFQQTTHLQYRFLKKRDGWIAFTWRYDSGLVNGSIPDYATALTLAADQQAAIGLFCGNVFATLSSPITACSDPHRGALRVRILPDGTENDDKNPPRVAPRHLFDVGIGSDNLFKTDRYKMTAKLTVVNLTNKEALYNFLSTFSGTHFVTPRSYTAEVGFTF
jgi:hypothetical protein